MERTKITTKYQTTIPKKIRQALGINVGDTIVFKLVDGNKVLILKPQAADKNYLKSLDVLLSQEWASKEDDEAFDDLQNL